MDRAWCTVCCTRHEACARCPGELTATGPERHGWRINVDTPRGIEAYGVLLAEADGLWRARILTYPNVLWIVPGGTGTIKFVGASAVQAERQAMIFVREHCTRCGYAIRDDLDPSFATPGAAADPGGLPRPPGEPAPRRIRFLPVRFGVVGPTEPGGTGNLSETGLFVITNQPVKPGAGVKLLLCIDTMEPVPLDGVVRWKNDGPRVGRSPGMGIQLRVPPPRYVDYVRALPA